MQSTQHSDLNFALFLSERQFLQTAEEYSKNLLHPKTSMSYFLKHLHSFAAWDFLYVKTGEKKKAPYLQNNYCYQNMLWYS